MLYCLPSVHLVSETAMFSDGEAESVCLQIGKVASEDGRKVIQSRQGRDKHLPGLVRCIV